MSSSGTWMTTAWNRFGMLGQGRAHEQAAVGAALNAECGEEGVGPCPAGAGGLGVWGGPSEDERAGLLGSHRRATPNPRQCRDRRPWSAHTRAPASH